MADLSEIRAALAAQITEFTGLAAQADAPGSVNPPVAVVIPGQPIINYADTVNAPGLDSAVTIMLIVLVIMSDAPPSDQVQRALDAYLGVGSGETVSIAQAINSDPSLGGVVHFCEPLTAGNYGRIDYAGGTYFGARVNVQVGAI